MTFRELINTALQYRSDHGQYPSKITLRKDVYEEVCGSAPEVKEGPPPENAVVMGSCNIFMDETQTEELVCHD